MATLLADSDTETQPTGRDVPEAVVVRFAGDSGDGMQLTGGQFTLSTALSGNDLATFPDFPAEIRAPQGTLFGVSAFQINFGSTAIETAGDQPDVLVAMLMCWHVFRALALSRDEILWLFHSMLVSARPKMLTLLSAIVLSMLAHLPLPLLTEMPLMFWK